MKPEPRHPARGQDALQFPGDARRAGGGTKPRRASGWRRRGAETLQVAAWVGLSAFAVWLAAWATLGDSLPYSGYFNAGAPFLCLGAAASSLLVVRRGPRLILLAVVPLAAAITLAGFGRSAGAAPVPPGAASFRVMTASLRTANRDMKSAAGNILGLAPDIAALQEVSDPIGLQAEMGRQSGRQWHIVYKGNTAILSAFPLRDTDQTPLAVSAIVDVGGPASLLVWSLRAPTKDFAQPSINRRFFERLASAGAEFGPDVIAGDLNASPWNDGHRVLRRGFRDSFEEAGLGPGFTFPTRARRSGLLMPFVRIDHIFVGQRVGISRAFVGPASTGADHFPVVVDLFLAP